MLTIRGCRQRTCGGLNRRTLLQAAGTGLFGVNLPTVLAAEQEALPFQNGRAKSVLFLLLFGGPSQLETFDMKPAAPAEIRGPFRPIASRTPGLQICEHLSQTAQISDKFAVVRSMTMPYNDHGCVFYIQTGRPHPARFGATPGETPIGPNDPPSMGSVVEYLSRHHATGRAAALPDYVYLPNRLGALQDIDRGGQYAGWLGRSYNALATDIRKRNKNDNPYFRDCTEEELDFRIKGLAPKVDVSLDRLAQRSSLLEQFDQQRRLVESSGAVESYDVIRRRATELATSEQMRVALDIRRESAALRDRYGRHLFGQSVLMGRRMIEAGSRFVTVAWDTPDGYSWDSHRNSDDVKKYLIPGFDQTFSALLCDLEDRGLLDETLVVAVGEMGRTPRANKQWGRDHWTVCFPAVLAGAGIRGGITYGSSDAKAAYPDEHPTRPEDLSATIFQALGIDPHMRIPDPQGRPVPLVENGRALTTELFG